MRGKSLSIKLLAAFAALALNACSYPKKAEPSLYRGVFGGLEMRFSKSWDTVFIVYPDLKQPARESLSSASLSKCKSGDATTLCINDTDLPFIAFEKKDWAQSGGKLIEKRHYRAGLKQCVRITASYDLKSQGWYSTVFDFCDGQGIVLLSNYPSDEKASLDRERMTHPAMSDVFTLQSGPGILSDCHINAQNDKEPAPTLKCPE